MSEELTWDTGQPRLGAPVWLELTTDDAAAAQQFYQALFGWTFSKPDPALGDHILISAAGVTLGRLIESADVEASEGRAVPSSWNVYLAVDNTDAALQQVRNAGGTVLSGPHDVGGLGRSALVHDPSGAAVGLSQAHGSEGLKTSEAHGQPVWFESMSMDFDASLGFYRDVLSWDIAWMGPEGGSEEFRYVTNGSGTLAAAGLFDAAAALPAGSQSFWRTYFAVDDTDAVAQKIQQLGGQRVSESIDSAFGRFAGVADPSGAGFIINQAGVRTGA